MRRIVTGLARPFALFSAILLSAALLAGCYPQNGGPATPSATSPAPGATALAGQSPLAPPAPGTLVAESPLAAPTSPLIMPTVAAPGTGTIVVRLHRVDGTPIRDLVVYVAPIVIVNKSPVTSVDPMVEPHAITDASGTLVLGNLKPGPHAFVAQSPTGLMLLHEPSGATLATDVKANTVTSLGDKTVDYSFPD